MKKLMMIALCALAANVAMADKETVNGIEWRFVISGDEATVRNDMSISLSAIPSETAGAIEIPSILGGRSVTSIGASAFWCCSKLTSVTIPSSVTSIGDDAFMGCGGLTSVEIPSSVTSIGAWAFYGCSGFTSVAIPSSVTSIGEGAFNSCSGLTSVAIPSGVTSIGEGAFNGCSGLTGVTIPSGVTSIGDYAFSGCRGLTSVEIPSSVTSIGAWAFNSCSGLTSVTIPSSVTSIGDYAFYNCFELAKVSLLPKAVSIGSDAFYICYKLKTVVVSDWDLFANTDWSTWFGPSVEVSGPVTREEADSVSFAMVPTSGDKVISAADYATACKAYGLTPKTAPQVVQEGEIAVTKESLQAAKAETVTVADGVVSLGVTVNTNGNFTAETKSWAPVELKSENVKVENGKIVISIPVDSQSGFMILQSGDAKVGVTSGGGPTANHAVQLDGGRCVGEEEPVEKIDGIDTRVLGNTAEKANDNSSVND